MSDESDIDADFMCGGGEDDEELEYEEPEVDLENQYYNSKALKEDDPQAALISFQKVLELEDGEKSEWGFRAFKQMMKIHFRLSNFDEMMKCYETLWTYYKSSGVTRNYFEKSINAIFGYVSTSENMAQKCFEAVLRFFKETKPGDEHYKLLFTATMKLGKIYYKKGDFTKMAKILEDLNKLCESDPNPEKDINILEIYVLEIQMHTALKNDRKLRIVYGKALEIIKSATYQPAILAAIRECGGKMYLRDGDFEKAYTDFYQAFKNYDEIGNERKIACLKYLALTNMLMKSAINPFDSQEAKAYKNHPEIVAMTNLLTAYHNNDTKEFERILKEDGEKIMDDHFLGEHIKGLLKNIRVQALVELIKPYTKVKLQFIADELNMTLEDVEDLLVSCILDKIVPGRIDQINNILVLNPATASSTSEASRYEALDQWMGQLSLVQSTVADQLPNPEKEKKKRKKKKK